MPRFFIQDTPSGEYLLSGEPGRHGAKVLRLRPGEEVTLCDGRGADYICTVRENTGESLLLDVGKSVTSRGEPRVKITVCQCLPKGDKLETVVQKAVELGAYELWPVESRYCVVKWDQKSQEKKLARLQKIALEAAMQSGRGIVPKVLEPAGLGPALERARTEGDVLFLYERAANSLRGCLKNTGDRLFLFVGPEGGFSEEEAALAEKLGARITSLGPRILRTETAPIAALAAIFYEKGDMEL
ncbi:16S rRNA (uracil(1498)-N(3))-methyltransferase [Acutalibacter sp. 1XD8-36]|uniref:16S rRNA (uracil(1498)-N(3))-methyltransferase n=1 Tax=Acutalibacter sp. 1XD8-36 TaxID=2320852 RepID=UPI0014123C3C|nr:16S rRNA (uracil(1498)-N(3))-methyltransferase [Acutalibacter sp. 1XD8-36]NBJ89063.1 16S rRNA (uracil(1498)-N(3))-methyltransferase [Acutalibacter sp. 1XD8-36]